MSSFLFALQRGPDFSVTLETKKEMSVIIRPLIMTKIVSSHVPSWARKTLLISVCTSLLLPFADRDDCSPNPCEHGGACADQINDFICTCAAGYTGKSCENGNWSACLLLSPSDRCEIHDLMYCSFLIDINDCAVNPCQNSGTCTDLVNDYNCTCIPGYTGQNCTQGNMLNCSSKSLNGSLVILNH